MLKSLQQKSFDYNNDDDDSYDVFISYEMESESKVEELYEDLIGNYQITIWMRKAAEDLMNAVVVDKTVDKNVLVNDEAAAVVNTVESSYEKEILKSKVFLCCLTKPYIKSRRCKNEITYAYTNDKNILILPMEKLTFKDLNTIAYAVKNVVKCDFTNSFAITKELIEELLLSIKSLVGHKIKRLSRLERRRSAFLKDIKEKLAEFEIEDTIEEEKVVNKKREITDQINDRDYLEGLFLPEYCEQESEIVIDPSLIKLRKLKSNSLFSFTCGFNRLVYLEHDQRYLITSSYNHSIIITDQFGNWVCRKNPNGLLKAPWAICLSEQNEVFVGDNEVRCIFVFDINLKYLRQIAKNTLNGFFDFTIDNRENEIYAVNLYDSIIAVIDIKSGVVKRKVHISTPSFVRVTLREVFVISASDFIYSLDKNTLQMNYTIKIKNSKYLNGLYVDAYSNIITTIHNNDEDRQNTRDVYICVVKHDDRLNAKKIKIGLTQVNDMVILKNRMSFICDTHIDLFEYESFNKI